MVDLTDLNRIDENEWEIPKSFRSDMRVPVRIIASEELIQEVTRDKSLEQAVNTACLPGLVGNVVVMPDMHQGYGFPIGGVAATRYPEGVISPGAIGYDINCGVRLLSTNLPYEEVDPFLSDLATELYRQCPSGVGVSGHLQLDQDEMRRMLREGSRWAEKEGYATSEDVRRTEEGGRLEGADPDKVSQRAMNRGKSQVGTLGSGNHFLEVDLVAKVFDEDAAEVMGLRKGNIALQIHTGSRGFGHQVCTDYVQSFQSAVNRYGIELPDRELVCAPMNSQEGKDYLAAMRCAANFAFTNRQVLAYYARRSFENALAGKVDDWHLRQVYDVAHNMGKIETHTIDGETMKVCVHRKGATRSFPPGSEDLPPEYKRIGQPVLVPGSMGTASWVLKGTAASMERSFGSTCHGAGRTMSRSQAKREVWGEDLKEELEREGIHIRAKSMAGLAEEAPVAYKDVDAVVDAVASAGIADKVALLTPLAVVKG
ncbi:MAG: RtcB family protein [Anaerolineales bacterium]